MAQSLGTPDLGNFPGGPVAKTLLPTQGGPGSLPRPHTPRELPWWSSG